MTLPCGAGSAGEDPSGQAQDWRAGHVSVSHQLLQSGTKEESPLTTNIPRVMSASIRRVSHLSHHTRMNAWELSVYQNRTYTPAEAFKNLSEYTPRLTERRVKRANEPVTRGR